VLVVVVAPAEAEEAVEAGEELEDPAVLPDAAAAPPVVDASADTETATAVMLENLLSLPSFQTSVAPPSGLVIVEPVTSDSVAVPFCGRLLAL
jgi:hypothetical protein